MITHTIELKVEKPISEIISLYPLGDIHLGNVGCDKNGLRRKVKEIAENPLAYWIGMGDYAEYIGYLDPRFEAENVDPEYKVHEFKYWGQRMNRDVVKELEPIKEKCLGMLRGNHEKTVSDKYLFDPALDLAERFKTKYLGYECMLRIYVIDGGGTKRYSFVIYAHHGFGGGRKHGAVINNLVDLSAFYEADLFITGHTHKTISTKTDYLFLNTKGNLYAKDRGFLVTGTFLRMKQEGMEGYEVRKGLPPTYIGTPHVKVHCDREWNHRFELVI